MWCYPPKLCSIIVVLTNDKMMPVRVISVREAALGMIDDRFSALYMMMDEERRCTSHYVLHRSAFGGCYSEGALSCLSYKCNDILGKDSWSQWKSFWIRLMLHLISPAYSIFFGNKLCLNQNLFVHCRLVLQTCKWAGSFIVCQSLAI